MFTGLVRDLGTLKSLEKTPEGSRLLIHSQLPAHCFEKGQSIAVNGVCLTVESYEDDLFSATAVPETLSKTQLGGLKSGDRVNLEPPLTLQTPLGGHLVSGHVDCVGKVAVLPPQLTVLVPADLHRFLAPKGSVTVNGVSLTIVDSQPGSFSVALIPETLAKTNLGSIQVGDSLNIEIDLLARTLDHLTQHS